MGSQLGHVVTEEGIRYQKLPWTCLLLLPVWLLYKLTETKTAFAWKGECQQAFDSSKGSLTSARVLSYLTREGKFVLDTDTSDHGIGVVLSQLQDGMERPIAFASWLSLKSERNYYVTHLSSWQLLSWWSNIGITWFCIQTDHAPCVLSLKLRIQKDNWHVGLNS